MFIIFNHTFNGTVFVQPVALGHQNLNNFDSVLGISGIFEASVIPDAGSRDARFDFVFALVPNHFQHMIDVSFAANALVGPYHVQSAEIRLIRCSDGRISETLFQFVGF